MSDMCDICHMLIWLLLNYDVLILLNSILYALACHTSSALTSSLVIGSVSVTSVGLQGQELDWDCSVEGPVWYYPCYWCQWPLHSCAARLLTVFNTVDHYILLHQLETSFGCMGSMIWIWLVGRHQYIHTWSSASSLAPTWYCVAQASVLGPILLLLYTIDLSSEIKIHGLYCHMYSDGTQIYVGFCHPHTMLGIT